MTPIKYGDLVKLLLATVGTAGILTVGAAFQGLAIVIAREIKQRNRIPSIQQAIYRMDKKGWILTKQLSKGYKITLSKKGWEAWQKYETSGTLPKPKKWDQKWRLLIFDIPESRRSLRDRIRHLLRQFGFLRLQDSVWVYPYECREVLELLRTRYKIRSQALYVRVDALDNDHWLKKEFGLK
ncbi:MAG: CRISPR-associated endonuclease Cas2 [Candidatus Uhrbacteria bacterium]|nr:CRISPR-associated endonuclease Cas2 [Candidatus Uhrbacteria bacterium]